MRKKIKNRNKHKLFYLQKVFLYNTFEYHPILRNIAYKVYKKNVKNSDVLKEVKELREVYGIY